MLPVRAPLKVRSVHRLRVAQQPLALEVPHLNVAFQVAKPGEDQQYRQAVKDTNIAVQAGSQGHKPNSTGRQSRTQT